MSFRSEIHGFLEFVLADEPFMIALHAGVIFLQYRQSTLFRELAKRPDCPIWTIRKFPNARIVSSHLY
jgi:hypothetical protein